MNAPFALDHASLRVPDLEDAISLFRRLGLNVTRTAAAPDRHSRLFLNRSYVEVAASSDPLQGSWELPLFFLRFRDRGGALHELRGRGLDVEPAEYWGVDGRWEELKIASQAKVPVPILVRRVEPTEIAADWPPALANAHPIGAIQLQSILLSARSLPEAQHLFQGLLATPGTSAGPDRLTFRCGSARVIIQSGPLERIAGLSFRVESLARATAFLREQRIEFAHDEREGLWLKLEKPLGIELGFTET